MSKLNLDSKVPSAYNRASFADIIRSICNQLNPLSEGRLAARYGAMTAYPTAGSWALGDIVWNSQPTAGSPLGWVCVSSGSPGTFEQFGGMPVLGTEVATTSGTSIDFTGIPSWVKKIVIQFVGVSTTGSSPPIVQLGDSGGIETTGYTSAGLLHTGAAGGVTTSTAGFLIRSDNAAYAVHGALVLSLQDGSDNTWTAAGVLANTETTALLLVTGGSKALSAVLDRVRITTAGGTDTFDAGAINILYE